MRTQCKTLRAFNYYDTVLALCEGGTPVPIPDGEPIPNKSSGDRWLVRLGEFDAELRGKPGTMVALYLRVEAAEYLDDEPGWFVKDEDGYHESKKPWCVELLFATRHMTDKGAAALSCCGQDDPFERGMTKAERVRATRIVEECAIDYGASAVVFTGFCTDDELDAGVQEALVQAQPLLMMSGFYLDRQMNAIGDSGWDFITGDIGASLRRYSGV